MDDEKPAIIGDAGGNAALDDRFAARLDDEAPLEITPDVQEGAGLHNDFTEQGAVDVQLPAHPERFVQNCSSHIRHRHLPPFAIPSSGASETLRQFNRGCDGAFPRVAIATSKNE